MSFKLRIASLLFFLVFPMASFAQVSPGCSNSYIRKSPSNRMESQLYLIEVPLYFSPSEADILATYKSISSQQNPSHQCVFTKSYAQWYEEGVCKNLQSGRVTSIWGGSGYRIGEDGNTQISDRCYNYGNACAYIEDSKGNRIEINNDITHDLYQINVNNDAYWHIIRECSSGSIEAITLMKAFPGYAILQRSVETGFVNTYRSAPSIQF